MLRRRRRKNIALATARSDAVAGSGTGAVTVVAPETLAVSPAPASEIVVTSESSKVDPRTNGTGVAADENGVDAPGDPWTTNV